MSKEEIVKVVRKGSHAVVVYPDYDCASNPREWDNLGKLFLKTRSVWRTECTEDDVREAVVKLPVYKYEHSGISLSTSNDSHPFNDMWDACLAGYIIATREDILKEFGKKRLSEKMKEQARKILKDEVETYDKYINGDVYGFRVFSGVTDDIADEDIPDECEEEDSCWGFYSEDDAVEEGLATIHEEVTA